MKNKVPSAIFAILFLLTSCTNVFEYSPYQANVKSDRLKQQSGQLKKLFVNEHINNKTITFATISDSHVNYTNLIDAVNYLNSIDTLDFVVHLGDMTHRGLLKEFEIFNNCTKEIKHPFFTAIGNHDYLSNGEKIYKQMYGDYNYIINYKGRKLVFYDGTRFESSILPNIDWFTSELGKDSLPTIIFSHIPPWGDQYLPDHTEKFRQAIITSNIILCMHGHDHSYFYGEKLNSEVDFLVPGATLIRHLAIVKIDSINGYSFKIVKF